MGSHVNHRVDVGLVGVIGQNNGHMSVDGLTKGTPAKFQKITMKPHLESDKSYESCSRTTYFS